MGPSDVSRPQQNLRDLCTTGRSSLRWTTGHMLQGRAGRAAGAGPEAPDRYFVPPYVGSKGWVGAWLDHPADWDEVAGMLLCSYRLIAPKRILALLDEE